MNNIRVYINSIPDLTRKEILLFSDKPMRIMENKNIRMLCRLFMSNKPKMLVDDILYTLIRRCNYDWINDFEKMNDNLNTHLTAWLNFLNIDYSDI